MLANQKHKQITRTLSHLFIRGWSLDLFYQKAPVPPLPSPPHTRLWSTPASPDCQQLELDCSLDIKCLCEFLCRQSKGTLVVQQMLKPSKWDDTLFKA